MVPLTCRNRLTHAIRISSTSSVHDEGLVLMAWKVYGVTKVVTPNVT